METPVHEPERSSDAQVAAAGAWGLSGRSAVLVANLLATPFTIRFLGPSRYGLWALLQTSLAWARLADVGMASASTKFGADRYASGDDQGESAVVYGALTITGISTTLVASVAAIAGPTILGNLLHVPGPLLNPGVVALRVVCALFVVQAIAGIVNTPQVVRLRWRQYTLVTSTASLLAVIGPPIALVIFSGGLVTVTAVGLGAAVFGMLGNLLLALRLQPALRLPRLNKTIMRQLLAYGGALTVSGLASIPLSTAERFFLAHNHSTTVVAYYSVAATLGTVLNVLPEQLVGPLLPSLTKLQAQGRPNDHHALYRKSLAGLFLVLTPATMILAFLARPFLSLWAGPAYALHSTGPFLVIIGAVWLNCFAWVPVTYLLSSGRTKLIAYVQLVEVLPYVAAAYVLTEKFGAMGAAIVWSATIGVDAVAYFGLARRIAHLPVSPLSEQRWRSIGSLVALGCALVLAATVSSSFAARIAWAIALGVIYAMAVWRLVLTAKEREALSRLILEILRRGPAPLHSRPAS
jgi:O-antigen/teichoic acid export membrane protein